MSVTIEDPATQCCNHSAKKRSATLEHPYHYVGSGLQNVYLVGVTYFVCPTCGKQSAEIPAMKSLHEAIARTIVGKSSQISGDEVRFLRKRLNIKAKEFAKMVSLTPEYLSSVENSPDPIDPGRDKLVRIIYRALSGDRKLRDLFCKEDEFQGWITSISTSGVRERITASRLQNNQWKVEAITIAA